jgi:dolichol kinase
MRILIILAIIMLAISVSIAIVKALPLLIVIGLIAFAINRLSKIAARRREAKRQKYQPPFIIYPPDKTDDDSGVK